MDRVSRVKKKRVMGPDFVLTPSSRCVFQTVSEKDASAVEIIYRENHLVLDWLGTEQNYSKMAKEVVLCSELPPGGAQEYVYNTVIRHRETQKLLGILECYQGYPEKNALYIGALFLRPCTHRQGFGMEVVDHLVSAAFGVGYGEVYAAVGLKNWPALRFWLAAGFTRATKVSGDAEYKDSTFAVIELVRDVSGGQRG